MFFAHPPSSSRSGSRPTSRPPSPTRTNTRSSLNSTHSAATSPTAPVVSSNLSVHSTYPSSRPSSINHGIQSHQPHPHSHPHPTINTSDINELLSGEPSAPSPAYGPYTPASEMGWSTSSHLSSGANTPGGHYFHGSHHACPLEIILDSENLVMRGAGGDMNPAYLSGRVELDLVESMNIKEISMVLIGKAKVQFTDVVASKNHHYTHPLVHHDWSFLEGDKRHVHTLKAGHHSFPFQLMLDSALPSSISTYSGDALVQYKLRATVIRSGFTHSNIIATKSFDLQRTYTQDALEFNQTLEIENTWPGKVMYSLTLPYKAYAAGDDIPVAVKFMPLAKGVRVTAVTSSIKEYTTVHTRHSSHNDSRSAAGAKHEFKEGRAVQVMEEPLRPPTHNAAQWANIPIRRSSTNLAGMRSNAVAGPSGSGSGSGAGSSTNANMTDEEMAAAAAHEDVMIGDDEVNTIFSLYIPPWATPTHTIHPVSVTHKLKWSCTITNPDGHISELRCALPIIILAHSLLDEARAAGSSTRALLLGETVDEAQNVDLPSYSNHVYDRVAADSGPATGYTSRSSRTPTGIHTPASATPPQSRPVSRPASPVRRESNHEDIIPGNPPRRELSFEADSELLRALGALEAHSISPSPSATPSGSRAPSRPLSRRGSFSNPISINARSGRSSNVNSRPGSRAASPDRSHPGSAAGSYVDENNHMRSGTERRSTGLASRFHLPHSFKPLKPLSSKPILRNSSASNLIDEGAHVPRNASFPGLNSGSRNVSFHHTTAPHDGRRAVTGTRAIPIGGGSGSGAGGVGFHLATSGDSPSGSMGTSPEHDFHLHREADPISQVPSYDIARRGFASAMDTGLPTYDKSNELEETATAARTTPDEGQGLGVGEQDITRARSDSALVDLASAAREGGDGECAVNGSGGGVEH